MKTRSISPGMGFLIAASMAVGAVYLTGQPAFIADAIKPGFDGSFSYLVSLQFLVLFPVYMILEYIVPAHEEQVGFSPEVAFDFLYTFIQLPLFVGVGILAQGPIDKLFSDELSWLVVDSTRQLPIWALVMLGVLFYDFLNFVAHYLKHRIKFLWRFHCIHHSQERMNLFTANRAHPIDSLFTKVVTILPTAIFLPSIMSSASNIMWTGFIVWWWARLSHTNIKTNLGALRWLFVTPQSHRIHHSAEADHWNSNYGEVVAWDRVFGTQHKDDQSYPPTSIGDPVFPEPKKFSFLEFIDCYWQQLCYPFDRDRFKGDPRKELNFDIDIRSNSHELVS